MEIDSPNVPPSPVVSDRESRLAEESEHSSLKLTHHHHHHQLACPPSSSSHKTKSSSAGRASKSRTINVGGNRFNLTAGTSRHQSAHSSCCGNSNLTPGSQADHWINQNGLNEGVGGPMRYNLKILDKEFTSQYDLGDPFLKQNPTPSLPTLFITTHPTEPSHCDHPPDSLPGEANNNTSTPIASLSNSPAA